MGTWSISPTDGGASIDENGVANIPSNVGGDDFITYEIKYTDDDGCSTSIDYEVPPCDPQCECSDIEGRITYTNTYLPVPSQIQRNVMLFSANTQGCGSISAFCSSTHSSIFSSDGDNLVRVEEIETNKKYAVYANVRPYREEGNKRSCTVNIYITKRDGVSCQEIVKTFVQDETINCAALLSTSSWGVERYLGGKLITSFNGGYQTIAETRDADNNNSKMFFLIDGDCPSWIAGGNVNNLAYFYNDGKWTVQGMLGDNSASGSQDRTVGLTQVGYILDEDKTINPGQGYTANQLKKMAGTQCGESSKTVTITQWGCNCKHAWTSSTTSEILEYNATPLTGVNVDINSYLNGCARLTAVESIDTCDWANFNLAGTGTYANLRIFAEENNTIDYRDCNIRLYITDSSGNDPCQKTFLVRQRPHPLDCTNCDSVNAMGYYVPYKSSNDIKADGTANGYSVRYEKSLEDSPCNGTVTFTFDSDGISHPVINPSVTKEYNDGSHVLCYFSADPNTESTTRSIKAVAHYRNGSLSDCTKKFTIEQDAVPKPPTPTPTYYIRTEIVRGDGVTTFGNTATKFVLEKTWNYTFDDVNITLDGSSKIIEYEEELIGGRIYKARVYTDANELCEATINPTTITTSTTLVTITVTSSTQICNDSSYDFILNHTQGGATDTSPIAFSPGERKKIGELQNSIPFSSSTCCQIEMSTLHTSAFLIDLKHDVVAKSSGGYELWATALTGLSASEVAPIDVTWSYINTNGVKKYPTDASDKGTIFLQNNP